MKKAPLFLTVMALLTLLAALQWTLPARETSEMENRELAAAPEFSLASVRSEAWMAGLEEFAADQLPLRDSFVALHTASLALLGRRTNNGVIAGAEGWLFDRSDGWLERNVRLNAAALRSLAEKTGRRTVLLAVPSSASAYPEYVPAHSPLADERALLKAAGEETETLPLLEKLLESREGAPLYYRTDHHWTARGAALGYEAACAALHLTPLPLPEENTAPGFRGSYYARDPLPWQKSDTLGFFTPAEVSLWIGGEEKEGLYDASALSGRDKYAALLYGNPPLIELRNDGAPAGELFVIKDSYANALLPLLARHYRRVVAADARYFPGNIVETVMQCEGGDILCVCGLSTLATGRAVALLDGL